MPSIWVQHLSLAPDAVKYCIETTRVHACAFGMPRFLVL